MRHADDGTRPLVIIPARAGSKGVQNKNFEPLPDGTTLLSRAIRVALEIGNYVVSTDAPLGQVSEHLYQRNFSSQYLKRPDELAADDTPMREVVEHVLAQIPGDPKQLIVLLQPTTPLRTVENVRVCCESAQDFPSATVSEVPMKFNRSETMTHYGTVDLPQRRQDARQRYIFTGECYAFVRNWQWMDVWRGVVTQDILNVDTPADWEALCQIIRRQTSASTPEPTSHQ